MKVLLLTWDFPPRRGGIQIWMFELARRLPDAEVRVIAPAMPGDQAFEALSGLWVKRLQGARLGQMACFVHLCWATLPMCLTWRPDLIVSADVLVGLAALLAKVFLRIPYVVFTHVWEIRRKRRQRLVGLVLRKATLVLANSHFTEAFVRNHRVSPERVRILYPGVDPGRFVPDLNEGDAALRPGPKTLLSVSRLDDLYKGNDTVIRALPLVKAKCPDVLYLIAGDGRLSNYFAHLVSSLGLGRDVVFLGEVSDETLPGLYRSCDVFVQISREADSGGAAEGFGIACLEAQASGKPVVAGYSGGLPEAVSDGVTGILVNPNDLSEVGEAIVNVLRDKALAQRLGREGRARVLRGFTWDHMATRARALFAEAAGQVSE